MTFERPGKGSMAVVARCQRNFGDVHCTHAQLAPGPFHAHSAHVPSNVHARVRHKDAVKMGHRKARHLRQHGAVERLIDVKTNVLFHRFDAFGIRRISERVRHVGLPYLR